MHTSTTLRHALETAYKRGVHDGYVQGCTTLLTERIARRAEFDRVTAWLTAHGINLEDTNPLRTHEGLALLYVDHHTP